MQKFYDCNRKINRLIQGIFNFFDENRVTKLKNTGYIIRGVYVICT